MLVNLTPHSLSILLPDGGVLELPPSGQVARVSAVATPASPRHGVPCVVATFGEPVGLPDPVEGTTYVVSGMVLDACDRPDLAAPGELVRDADGKPVGCRGLRVRA